MAQKSRGEGQGKVVVTAAGTSGGTTATIPAPSLTGVKTFVTHVSVSGDAAALVTIESPSGTVVWQKRYASVFADSVYFDYGEIETAPNTAVLVRVSASTSHCEANIAGLQAA